MTEQYQQLNSNQALMERLDIHFALKAARLGVWELDPATNVINWDDRCRELFGLATGNLIAYQQVVRHIHPQDVERVNEAVQRAMDAQLGGNYDVTYRTIGADDGVLRWVRFIGQSYFNEAGEVARFAGIAQDVTEDVQAQQREISEERFRSIIEQTPAATLVLRGDEYVVEQINEPMAHLIGCGTEVIGKPLLTVTPEIENQFVWQQVKKVYQEGISFDHPEMLVNHSRAGIREDHYYNVAYRPLNEGERITGVIQVVTEVTDQVLTRRKIGESDARFRSLVEEAPIATCLFVGREMLIAVANQKMIDYWGKDQTVIGKPLPVAIPESKSQSFPKILDEVFTTGRSYEAKAARTDLEINGVLGTHYFDHTYQPLRNAAGAVYAIMHMAVDVTEQVMARQQLEVSEERFRRIFEQAPMAIGLFRSRDMVIEAGNDRLFDVWGKDPSITGLRLAEAIPEVPGQGFIELLEGVYDTGEPFFGNGILVQLERRGKLEDVYFDFTYTPLRDATDAVTGVMVLATEVTKQIIAQQKLRESEHYFHQLTDTVPAIIWETDVTGYCTYLNKQWYDYTGQTREEAEGFGWLDATHPDDQEATGELFMETNKMQASFNALYRLRGKDGSYHWSIDKANPRFDANGVYKGMIGTVVDVHEQTVARQQLVDSEAKFRALIEEAPVATCLFVGRELRIDIANEAMITVWGKGRSVIGQPLAQALPELQGQHFLSTLDDLFTSGNAYDANAGRADLVVNGILGTYYFDYNFKPLRNATGDVYAILETAVDVTEQVQSRQQLEASENRFRTLASELDQQVQLRTQQLQASVQDLQRSNQNLQQFAYVASHDLQEPLRKIQSFGDLLKTQYANQLGEGADHLQRMQSAASRMSVLIKDLLAFSRISTQQDATTPVPLTEVVQAVLNDLEVIIADTGAQVRVFPLPTVHGDKSQLGQLFQNLLSNALKFRRAGTSPTVRITAQYVAATDLPASVRPARAVEGYHRIDVADNGIGFNDKYVDRIFQVFQRLHGRSEYAGTGIGLAICEKVVTNHGGAIAATSQPGQGATFSVYLPVL